MTERQEVGILTALTNAVDRLPSGVEQPAAGLTLLVAIDAPPPPDPGAVEELAGAFRRKHWWELRGMADLGYAAIWLECHGQTGRLWPE